MKPNDRDLIMTMTAIIAAGMCADADSDTKHRDIPERAMKMTEEILKRVDTRLEK